jgi:ATP-binding cassette subfamily B (MDR/TAP) protein 1
MTLIVPAIGEFAKASAAAQGLFEVIDQKSEIDPLSPAGKRPDLVTGRLVLDNVSFAYPSRPSVKILDGLTLEFEARKTTAIVGPSGSGKSTIVSLLTRWFDPSHGCVRLDGEDVRDLNVHWLRSQMGFVQQESVLFSDTIFNNISHGLFGTAQDHVSDEEKLELVRNACKQSFADGFVEELPERYGTFVGARGSLLSGGQKQRVAIARSVIRNPPILLLDEATSALDPRAEGIVQKALDNVSKTRTTIVIAHKLSTVQKADKIIVLSKGKLMEQGTHQELLAKKGLYFALVNAQSLEQRQDDQDNQFAMQEDIDTASESAFPDKDIENDFQAVERRPPSARGQQTKQLTVTQSLKKIVKEQRRLWPYFLGGLLGALGSGSVFPVQAVVFSRAILIFQYELPEMAHKLQSKGNFWGWMFLVIALGVLVCYACLGFFFTMTAFHVSSFYRSKYYAAMINQDIGYFEGEGCSASTAISRLSTDPQRVQDLISTNLGFILQTLVNVVGSCTLALAVGWKIAVVAIFGCLPPLFLAGFVRMRIELTSQERMTSIYLESARFGAEAVSAIRTVSSLTLEEKVMKMYNERLDTKAAQSLIQTLISNFLFALTESVYLATLALVFWWGTKLLSQHEYSVQEFFMVFVAVIFGGQAAGFMFGSTLTTTKAMGSAKSIINLLASKPPINTSAGKKNIQEKRSDMAVEFRNASFSYPTRPNAPVLQHLGFSIRSGESIGIAGASGSGKSTIIALLERFYEANSGDILIHGTPLQELDVHAHRSRIGLVSQDTTLYQGSVRDNVLFGIPEGSEIEQERVIRACKDANIHDFIQSLPEGYDTDAGTRGIALSGGQRQRIAIARALVRDPEILLLDEATSALDSESEALVQEAIEKASRGRTMIAVAHRLSTIQRCDRIMVLHAGRVAEEGSPTELHARRGRYYQMVLAQSLDRELTQS